MNSVIIGIDGNEANVDHLVGVSVYTHELLQRFATTSSPQQRFVVYLRTPPKKHMPPASEYFTYRVVWGPRAWASIFLPLRLMRNPERLTVFFSPAHYMPAFIPVPTVVTIHDLSYVFFPDEFLPQDRYKLTRWTADAAQRATGIIAVSKTTKKDIVAEYGVSDDKVRVIYNGFRPPRTYSGGHSALQELGLKKNEYLLYVGTLQPRKNIQTLVASFEEIKTVKPLMKLVLAGKTGWMYEDIMKRIERSPYRSDIILPGYVSARALSALYHHACACVLPSLYEGFGIPILEAMAHGTPVIASQKSSLPEIGGDACLYFDPHEPHDLTRAITRIMSSTVIREDLVKSGRERIAQFSWDRTAAETLEVLIASSRTLPT